jgi:hypothetical protein
MACAARSSGRVRLNDPRTALASGVRELATMTASLFTISLYSSRFEPLLVAVGLVSI